MERIAENIAKLYDHLDGRKNRSAIFKHYRQIDDSSLWPIRGRYNVTDRAIRRLYRYEKESGEYLLGLELCYFIEDAESYYVNNNL